MDESCIPKIFITFFSRTARHKKLKQYKVTNMNKYSVLCILKSGCSYFFIPLFLPFSVTPIFQFILIYLSPQIALEEQLSVTGERMCTKNSVVRITDRA